MKTEIASGSTALTSKGERTRARIVAGAAELMFERGVGGTTLEDVKQLVGVSSSQLYHYFADKDSLVRAVIEHQADSILRSQDSFPLDTLENLRAWRDMVVALEERLQCRGGCPLGSLGSQLAESDSRARAYVAASFSRWEAALREGLRTMHAEGRLVADANPDELALAILAALQGGLLLCQIERTTKPLVVSLDAILALVASQTTR